MDIRKGVICFKWSNGRRLGRGIYVGARGSTVIDYVMTNEKAYDKVREFRIGDRVDSHANDRSKRRGRRKTRQRRGERSGRRGRGGNNTMEMKKQ